MGIVYHNSYIRIDLLDLLSASHLIKLIGIRLTSINLNFFIILAKKGSNAELIVILLDTNYGQICPWKRLPFYASV